ncbi:hypothetical protein GH714_025095 [Hevea brasiliensis]|uniref:hAT-like transposase RNase-H fold domain-containing protein n=1 Tax=Hevea brasiliensis TaxID=3981 RepID=A0A6A6MAD8_HEVBR|nr:hypothetical protein GH714_025095 [Hevea brasiliensis]
MQKCILNFTVIKSHEGVNIGNAIDFCMEWGVSKVMCITVDNASSNDYAVSQLKKGLLKKNAFLLGGDAFHMRCCAHIIQLVMRDGLDAVQGFIKRIKDVELHNYENSGDERIVEMGKQMKAKFDKYWRSLDKMNVMLFVAVVLDPRYKLNYVKAKYIIYYSKSEAKLLVDRVVNALKEMLNEYMSSNDQACMGDNSSGQNANVEKCDNAMIEEDEEIDDYFIQMEEQKLASQSELDTYLEELSEKFTLDFDLLL